MRNSEKQGFNCESCPECQHYICYGTYSCGWKPEDITTKLYVKCELNLDMERVKEEGVCSRYKPLYSSLNPWE